MNVTSKAEAIASDGEGLAFHLRQQAALAEFGREAVQAADLGDLLQRAATLSARGLGVDCAKVLELLPGGERLLVRAGIGWADGVVGSTTLGADANSPAGYALQTARPVITSDLQTEDRFRVPELLRRHGIRSALNVIIRGEAEAFGVLEVGSRHPNRFTSDHIAFLQGFANLLAAAIDRHRAERMLQAAAEEKALLLSELQHRVKNNMQVIASLVEMQARRAMLPEVRAHLETISHRVQALCLVHEQLHLVGGGHKVDMAAHLRQLCDNLTRFYGSPMRPRLRLLPVQVPVDAGVPLGLIANEFISNSLKHAFPEGFGTISLELERIDAHHARLCLADDGIGLPAAPPASGLGLQLIGLLVGQIGAEAVWRTDRGTCLELTFRG